MAWPNPQTAYLATGYTTIRWGSDGLMPVSSNGGSGGVLVNSGGGGTISYIVESIRANDRVDKVEIEQGTGLVATRIQLLQGRVYTLTVVDDTGMTLPVIGTYVTLLDVISGGSVTYTCRLLENGYNAARKVEGKREFTVEVLTLIELAGSLPAA